MTNPFEDSEDVNMDAIRGQSKKPGMSMLNQKKVSKWEMDELFTDDDYFEEF